MSHSRGYFFLKIMIASGYLMAGSTHATLADDQPVIFQSILTNESEDMSYIMSQGGAMTITDTPTGNIKFVQAFFYSNTSCTALLGVASAIDNVTGMNFSNGQTVNINASSTYKLANNKQIATPAIRCMKLYVDGGNNSSKGVACQSYTDETCTGASCSSNQTKNVPWVSNPTACGTRYFYVANYTANNVSKCTINSSTGALSGCVTTSGFSSPNGVTINNGYAYVGNNASSGVRLNTVSKCQVAASTGVLSGCVTTGGFALPAGIGINANYVYVTNNGSNTVSQCTVTASTGDLNCASAGGSGFNVPNQIVFNNSYAYIVNSGTGGLVSQCTVNPSSGTLDGCIQTGTGFSAPRALTINNGYAYIVNGAANNIYKCTVSAADGTLTSCGIVTSLSSPGGGIIIRNGFVYYNQGNPITRCTVSSVNGTFSSCGAQGSGFSGTSQSYIY